MSVPQKSILRIVVIHYCAWYTFLRNRCFLKNFLTWYLDFIASLHVAMETILTKTLLTGLKLQYQIDSEAAACKNSSGWVPIEINKARHLMNLGDHNGVGQSIYEVAYEYVSIQPWFHNRTATVAATLGRAATAAPLVFILHARPNIRRLAIRGGPALHLLVASKGEFSVG